MRLKRRSLLWVSYTASVPNAGTYRLNSENGHPGRIWFPEFKWRDEPLYNMRFLGDGSENPAWQIHEEFSQLESLLWPPTGDHHLTKAAAIRHCEAHAYLMSLNNSERRAYIRPFVEKLERMK